MLDNGDKVVILLHELMSKVWSKERLESVDKELTHMLFLLAVLAYALIMFRHCLHAKNMRD